MADIKKRYKKIFTIPFWRASIAEALLMAVLDKDLGINISNQV